MLIIKLKNLWMSEEETISDFNRKLCDIDIESFALGEKILEREACEKGPKILAT